MSAVGPVDHIARTPLPWRDEPDLTECGKNAVDVNGRIVTRVEIERRIRDVGKQRAAFTTCMTCAETSDRYTRRTAWREEDGAIVALGREIGAVQHATRPEPPRAHRTTVHTADGSFIQQQRIEPRKQQIALWDRRRRLTNELEAIAALVAAHREEFDAYLAGLGDTVQLAERRSAKRSRRARGGA